MTTHKTEIVSYRRGNTTGTRWRWVCSCKREGHWERQKANAQWSADQHVRRATHDGPCHRCGQQTVAVEAARKITQVAAEPHPQGRWAVAATHDSQPTGERAEVGSKVVWVQPGEWPDVPRYRLHDCRHTPTYKRLAETYLG